MPAAGVPLRAPVVVLRLTPAGSVPDSLNVGAGDPEAVTVKLPAVPTAKVVLFELVKDGGAVKLTVRVKLCVPFVPTPFCAVKVIIYGELVWVPDAGVPLSTPVVVLKLTPVGSVPVSLNVGAGNPEAVTVKLLAEPTAKVVLFWLVIAGAWSTVRVKACVAFGLTPFCAVMVIG